MDLIRPMTEIEKLEDAAMPFFLDPGDQEVLQTEPHLINWTQARRRMNKAVRDIVRAGRTQEEALAIIIQDHSPNTGAKS